MAPIISERKTIELTTKDKPTWGEKFTGGAEAVSALGVFAGALTGFPFWVALSSGAFFLSYGISRALRSQRIESNNISSENARMIKAATGS